MKRKTFDFQIKQIQEDRDGFVIFEGYASTFGNEDRGQDIVQKGAFIDSLKEYMPKLLWQHKMIEPIGVIFEAFEDDFGLFVKGKMPKEDSLVSGRVLPQMKVGSINRMSIGFDIIEKSFNSETNITTLISLKLWEVSLVTIPMNESAEITSFTKAITPYNDLPFAKIENGYEWSQKDALERVKEFTNSTDRPSKEYKKAFLIYDQEKENEFDGYKFLIADVIDGELKIVPRAIFLSSAKLKGAPHSVELKKDQKKSIEENINRYYKKLERKSPFEKSFSEYIDNFRHMKDVSDFMKSWGFSNNETNSLISSVKRISRNEASIARNEQETQDLLDSMKDLKLKQKELFLNGTSN